MRKRASPSKAAGCWLRLPREIHRTRSHDDAWHTFHSRGWSEFIKYFGIGFLVKGTAPRSLKSGPRTIAIKCMSKENTGANKAEKNRNCLNHRQYPCSRFGQNDMSRRTVKRISSGSENRNLTDDLEQQSPVSLTMKVGR
jgi:hypothetical protein